MSEGQENVRKRIRNLRTSLELSTDNDVIEFLLHHFDDKALEVNIERGIIFEDGRRAGRAEAESQICAEVSERLKAVAVPHFKHEQELLHVKRDNETLRQRVKALEKELEEAKGRENDTRRRLLICFDKFRVESGARNELAKELEAMSDVLRKRRKAE